MSPRERILAALSRRGPARLPVDFGGTVCSTVSAGAHQALRRYFDLPDTSPAAVCSRRASTVIPDRALVDRFHACALPLLQQQPDARPDRDLSSESFVDEWGVQWSRHGFSHYLPVEGPLQRIAEPDLSDLDRVLWPDADDPGRYRGLRERARLLHETTERAVILNLWLGPVHLSQFLRGFPEWLEDLLARPQFAEALMDRIVDIWVRVARRTLDEIGEYVDAVMYGDDIGTQRGPLIRPSLYRRMIQPRHRLLADTIKHYGKPIIFHTCGGVYDLIPDLIETGIDAINPVQVSAARMDTRKLGEEFGRDLSFWGAIDSREVLPCGSPATVREEVKRRIADLAAHGGYVLCAVHNIQPDVPPANVAAMYDAALELGA